MIAGVNALQFPLELIIFAFAASIRFVFIGRELAMVFMLPHNPYLKRKLMDYVTTSIDRLPMIGQARQELTRSSIFPSTIFCPK